MTVAIAQILEILTYNQGLIQLETSSDEIHLEKGHPSLQRAALCSLKGGDLKLAYVDCFSASLAGPDSDGLFDW